MTSNSKPGLKKTAALVLVIAFCGVCAWSVFHVKYRGKTAPLTSDRAAPDDGDNSLTKEQQDRIRQLQAIGYLAGTNPAPKKTGVTVYKKGLTFDGTNLYVSGHFPEATLIDMEGDVLHTWRKGFEDVWPDRTVPEKGDGLHWDHYWRRAHLYENGDLLAIYEGLGLIKVDKDSNLLWEFSGPAHHDLDVLENGDIYVLTRVARMIPRINSEKPVLEDFVTILDANGRVKRQVSMLEAFEKSEFAYVLDQKMPREGDLFHSNTLERFDGSLGHLSPIFKRGNILTSCKLLDTIAIIDMDTETVVWCRTGPWSFQHQPTLLKNGNMLIFDNNTHGDHSRVLEFVPLTGTIVWSYTGSPPTSFYTHSSGSCQLLPNGNILISETDDGRAFEVTRDRTIVWKFVNPHRADDSNERIAVLPELVRLNPEFPLDWIAAGSS